MNINNVNYHVDVQGEGEAIVLLHGFTSNLHTWDTLTETLASKYQVIRIDIIGHGATDSPQDELQYDIQMQASIIKEILTRLNISKTAMLGYSMGGRLAITFSCLYPEMVTALILESTTAGIDSEEARRERRLNDERIATKIEVEGVESFVQFWENIPLFDSLKKLPVELQERMRAQRLENNKVGLMNSLKMMGTGSQPNWWPHINRFEFPVLILAGEEDSKFCTIGKKLANNMNKAQFQIINGAGHIIHVEKPEIFGTIVEEFLNKTHIN